MSTLAELSATQPRVASVLSAALASGRMHHAYLLVGPEEAAGKRVAQAVARALVCNERRGSDGCGECSACRKLASGNHPDVITVTPNDKGVIAIDAIREAAARLGLVAAEALTKVVVIERADLATPQAQNALLKTLEEPPGPTCFLLTATRLRALLPTVRSRSLTLRLAPRDRQTAWRELAAAGTSEGLARALGPLVGADIERAQELGADGAEEILEVLRRALGEGASAIDRVTAAADLGQNRERADLALAMLEVVLRDALARKHGAADEQLYAPVTRDFSGPKLALAVERLQELRRLVALHVNRTLAIESVLAALVREGAAAQ